MATKEKKTAGDLVRMVPPEDQLRGGIVDPDTGKTVIYDGPSDVPAAHVGLLAAMGWSEEK